MFKKLSFSLFFLAAFMCLVFCASAAAAFPIENPYPVDGGNIYFDPESGAVVDCDYNVTKAEIPETINGVRVTFIDANAFNNCTYIVSVSAPSVETVEYNSFNNCRKLESVYMPNLVTVKNSAFRNCFSLTELDLPRVETLESNAFTNCSALKRVAVPNLASLSEWTFSDTTTLAEIEISPENPTYSFENGVLFNKDKTSVIKYCPGSGSTFYEAPESVKRVETMAFSPAPLLEDVVLPKVEILDVSAFLNCTSLKTVSAPRLSTVGNSAFSGCASLKAIDLPGVSTVDSYAFAGCGDLEEVKLKNVKSLNDSVFEKCSSLTDVYMPLLSSAGETVFSYCSSLETISLPALAETSAEFFMSCSSLNSVDLPKLKVIGSDCFRGCAALCEIDAPLVESVGSWAFSGCGSLLSVKFPRAENIGDRAFGACESLTEISLPSAKSIGESAFANCAALLRLSIPNVSQLASSAFTDLPLLKEIEISPDNKYYTFENGVLFSKDKSRLLCYLASNKNVCYTVPQGVKTIGVSAFCANETLRVLNLTSATNLLASGVSRCPSLRRLIMPNISVIDYRAIYSNDALEEVFLSKNLTAVYSDAFSDSPVARVYYEGSDSAVEFIRIDSGNSTLLSAEWICGYSLSDADGLLLPAFAGASKAKISYGETSAKISVPADGENISVYVSYDGGALIKKLESVNSGQSLVFNVEYGNDMEIFVWDENLSPVTESHKI